MLIIGLGNPDRGDDAAGVLVASRLAERGMEAIQHRGGMLDLIQLWQNAERVLIVDAVVSDSPPGTLHVWDANVSELRDRAFCSSTHMFGLADAIELARALHRLPGKLIIYGIEARQFVPGTPPSSHVTAGIERVVEQICCQVLRERECNCVN